MEIRSYIIGVAAATCSALPFAHSLAWEGNVLVSTPHTSLLLHAGEGQDLRFAYFGDRIEESQIHQIHDAWDGLNRTAYPTFGQPPHQIFALQAVHADGNWTTDLTGQGGNLYPRQRQTHGHHAEGQGLSFPSETLLQSLQRHRHD